ncbi:MAG: HDOD domain-containing protein [Planctomycetaceae bacterium]
MSQEARRFDSAQTIPVPHVLPALKDITPLIEMTDLDDVDFATFCSEVEKHEVIAGQIMRAARSVGTGRGDTVNNLRHAVALIGMRRIHNILDTLRQRVEDKERFAQSNESYGPTTIFQDQMNLHRA